MSRGDFAKHELDNALSWGQQLMRARERERWPLEEAAFELGISAEYLGALESMELRALPGKIYAQNFLRKYADWLDLPAEELLEQFEETWRRQDGDLHQERFEKPAQRVRGKHLVSVPHVMRWLVASFVGVGFLVYLGTQVVRITAPPALELAYPQTDIKVTELSLTVAGNTDPETIVYINESRIEPDTTGHFEEVVSLEQGVNTIRVEAQRKFSKTAVVERQVLAEVPEVRVPLGVVPRGYF